MAALFGVSLDELPPYLANIRENEIYSGNSRLSVGDPLEDLKNPWKDLNWRVGFFMSKSGYKTLSKKWGTTPQDVQKKGVKKRPDHNSQGVFSSCSGISF